MGLPGWVIRLRPVGATGPVYETTTDGTGYFAFPDMPAGRYVVWEVMRDGWTWVTDPEFEVTVPRIDGQAGCVYVRFKNRQATATPTALPTWTATRPPTATPSGTPRPYRIYLPIIGSEPPALITLTPTPTPTRPGDVPLPGAIHPKGVAVNPNTHRVYVTSRDNDQLYMLDGLTNTVLRSVTVGDEPWGVAVNARTNKVYVVNFAGGTLSVLDGASLTLLTTRWLGPNPTFVEINESTNMIFAVLYGINGLAVIDGATDEVVSVAGTGVSGPGGWR